MPVTANVLLAAGERAAARWRWETVADALLDAMTIHVPSRRRPTSPPTRVAVIGTRSAVDEVSRALSQTSEIEVHAFVDSPGEPVLPSRHGTSWPAAAFGRYVPAHDFDHVVTLLNGRSDEVAARIARSHRTHVWLTDHTAPDPSIAASSGELPGNVLVDWLRDGHRTARRGDGGSG